MVSRNLLDNAKTDNVLNDVSMLIIARKHKSNMKLNKVDEMKTEKLTNIANKS